MFTLFLESLMVWEIYPYSYCTILSLSFPLGTVPKVYDIFGGPQKKISNQKEKYLGLRKYFNIN